MSTSRDTGASAPRIIVGIDFSSHAHTALDHAMAIARRMGAELSLIHVGMVPDPEEVAAVGNPDVGSYRAILLLRLAEDRRQLAELRVRYAGQGVEVSHAVIEDMPDTGLARAAQDVHAELVVVGTHGRTGAARVLLGSTAERTARLAGCSVLVTRGEAPSGGYRRVVVGTDFSVASERALDRAMALAAPGADIHVVHCWSLSTLQHGDPDELVRLAARVDRERGESTTRFGRELIAARRTVGLDVRFDAIETPPVDGLLAAAEQADLVVVGSHGRRGVRRLFTGSVAEAVIRHARCSVLVAR